jgi:hypothetical protein
MKVVTANESNKRTPKLQPKLKTFRSFEEYIITPRPWGLGLTLDQLERWAQAEQR